MSKRNLINSKTIGNSTRETDALLIKAWKILTVYAKATGSVVCILDQDFLPIREVFPDVLDKTNTCINFCRKYSAENSGGLSRITRISDLRSAPCNMMHINAIKEAHRFGGSHIYMCELGFMFWTSPLYSNGRFIGALVGSGFIGIECKETVDAMFAMSRGAVSREDLKDRLAIFSKGEPERIKSLAELLLICAEYLSTGTAEYNEGIKLQGEKQSYSGMKGGALVPGYHMDKERLLLAALRRGDNEAGQRILNELLSILFQSDVEPFRFIQFRAMELVVLLSREAMEPEIMYQRSAESSAETYTGRSSSPGDAILETNNQYLRRIQEAKNIEDLTDVMHIIVERMSAQLFSFRGVRHASALRKAERFIWENYTRKISLQEIASAAGLSAPYFSTIFKEEMGENLSSYLNRLRVEKAEHMLTETGLTLNEIASSCGFEDQSWFSKMFKSYTGISPGKYRAQGGVYG
ncbi:MAG: helix-turn-helix domain-containing protein [Treponema sp.]|jgi:AraC-like DNA-binding protein/ligand-binding sensor protein|nr:helix-turn-helix domain-containing protein [Treponema sp.]